MTESDLLSLQTDDFISRKEIKVIKVGSIEYLVSAFSFISFDRVKNAVFIKSLGHSNTILTKTPKEMMDLYEIIK